MLDPHDRGLLSDQVLPPEGFQCTDALICTYSLDLAALAGIPLALLRIDPGTLGDDTAARIAAISAVREWSPRLTVVCQAGAIYVPAEWRDAYLWLEDTVVQVSPKADPRRPAVFHPKLWLLRFQRDEEVRYRLLVLSRNLTYDRSWDVVTRLDGCLTSRQNKIRANAPLVDFLEALGGEELPVVGADAKHHLRRRDDFARELWTVQFAPEDKGQTFAFWPLGVGKHRHSSLAEALTGRKSPFFEWASRYQKRSNRRMLVVSPFLSEGMIKALDHAPFPTILISRQDALDEVAAHLPQTWLENPQDPRVYEFLDALSCEDAPLSGLHAKLWVADDGHQAHIWTGSANATDAAFTRNVEFLLQLSGARGALGIDSVKGPKGMEPLIAPYVPQPAELDAEAIALRQQQRELGWTLTHLLANGHLRTRIDSSGEKHWDLSVSMTGPALMLGSDPVHWRALPITLAANRATMGTENTRRYSDLALHELSLFWAVTLTIPGTELRAEATVRLEPAGELPSFQSRESAAVARHLNDPGSLALYVEYLLAGGGSELARRLRRQRSRGAKAKRGGGNASPPLFETLLFALAEQPAALGDVVELLESAELDSTEGARRLREDADFQHIWAAFRQAQQALSPELASHGS